MKLIFSIILIMLLTACTNNQPLKMNYENIELDINDEIIESKESFSIIEPVWWSVSIYDGEKKYNEDLMKFSDPQKYVLAIQWYLSEVNNGGHDQFYFNSTGIVWEDALIGFKTIGLDDYYDILKQSAELMGGEPSKDRGKRQMQLEQYNPDFTTLDNKLFGMEDKIESELGNYIKSNREEFKFKGTIRKPVYKMKEKFSFSLF